MSKRILIIEDEESIADLEKDYLELSSFEVEVANDGIAGLKKGLEEDFDLIILDLMLPAWTDSRSAARSGTRRTHRSSWCPRRKTTSTRSGDWDWARTTI